MCKKTRTSSYIKSRVCVDESLEIGWKEIETELSVALNVQLKIFTFFS